MSADGSDLIVHEPFVEVITAEEWANRTFRTGYETAIPALQDGMAVKLSVEPVKQTRSIEANACMWAHLSDLAKQVVWYGQKLTSAEWKDVISSSLRKSKVVPGIDGGFVVLGLSTSKFNIKEMGLMIEAILAFGTQQGVRFSAPKSMYAWMESK